jgi:F-type H+-transporting ATPase subunit a
MIPGKAQNFSEVVVSGIEEFMVETAGEEARWLFPLAGHGFPLHLHWQPDRYYPRVFAADRKSQHDGVCAIVVVVFTHVIGVKYHGALISNILWGRSGGWLPLIFIIEIIGHLARILSLSFRLFGNMMGHEIVLAILFGLAGAFFRPAADHGLGYLRGFCAGFVFFLLSIIYFPGPWNTPIDLETLTDLHQPSIRHAAIGFTFHRFGVTGRSPNY